MIIVFLIVMVSLLIVVTNIYKTDKKQLEEYRASPKKECPPHKWSIHPVTDKYTCQECNFVAGSGFEPRGDE